MSYCEWLFTSDSIPSPAGGTDASASAELTSFTGVLDVAAAVGNE
jgi:hypothetical protein